MKRIYTYQNFWLGGTEYIFDYHNFSKRLTTNFYHKLLTSSNLSYGECAPPKKKRLPRKASTLDCPPGWAKRYIHNKLERTLIWCCVFLKFWGSIVMLIVFSRGMGLILTDPLLLLRLLRNKSDINNKFIKKWWHVNQSLST